MSAAVALMLEGMPSPRDCVCTGRGRVVVLVGFTVVAETVTPTLAMRNMAIVTLRRAWGSPGRVGGGVGLMPTYGRG